MADCQHMRCVLVPEPESSGAGCSAYDASALPEALAG